MNVRFSDSTMSEMGRTVTGSTHPDPLVRDSANKLLREAGYPIESKDANEAHRKGKWKKIVVLLGVLLAFSTAVLIDAHYTVKSLVLESVVNSKLIAGTATVSGGKPGWLSIQHEGKYLFSCSLRQCGFPGVYELSGKEIEVRVADGFILAVVVEGKPIDAQALRLEAEMNTFRFFLFLTGAIAALMVGALVRYKANAKHSRRGDFSAP